MILVSERKKEIEHCSLLENFSWGGICFNQENQGQELSFTLTPIHLSTRLKIIGHLKICDFEEGTECVSLYQRYLW